MIALGPASATVAFPVWGLAAIAVLFLLVALLATRHVGIRRVGGALVGYGLVLVALGTAWTFLDHWAERDRTEQWQLRVAERWALDARASDLTAHTLAPGSALACLDGLAGEAVESLCEKKLFASPEAAATAISYMSMRLGWLADGLDHARRFDASYEAALAPWRHAAELDRYGIVAQVLATRDGCTVELCIGFALLRDAATVKTNLREHTYEKLVGIYAETWKQRQEPSTAVQSSLPRPALPVGKNVDFPSAASIPPVSIMNPEPTGGVGAAASANASAGVPAPAAKRADPVSPAKRTAESGASGGRHDRRSTAQPGTSAAPAPDH